PVCVELAIYQICRVHSTKNTFQNLSPQGAGLVYNPCVIFFSDQFLPLQKIIRENNRFVTKFSLLESISRLNNHLQISLFPIIRENRTLVGKIGSYEIPPDLHGMVDNSVITSAMPDSHTLWSSAQPPTTRMG